MAEIESSVDLSYRRLCTDEPGTTQPGTQARAHNFRDHAGASQAHQRCGRGRRRVISLPLSECLVEVDIRRGEVAGNHQEEGKGSRREAGADKGSRWEVEEGSTPQEEAAGTRREGLQGRRSLRNTGRRWALAAAAAWAAS